MQWLFVLLTCSLGGLAGSTFASHALAGTETCSSEDRSQRALIHRCNYLEFVAIGADNRPWYTYHRDGDGRDGWQPWVDMKLGTLSQASVPAVVHRLDRLEVVAIDENGNAVHNFHSDGDGRNGWRNWRRIGRGFSADSTPAVMHRNGSLEAVFIGQDGHAWYSYLKDQDDLSAWHTWVDLGERFSLFTSPMLIHRDGFLEVMAIGEDGHLWYNYHRDGDGADRWHGWTDLGGSFSANSSPALIYRDGYLEVVAIGQDGHAWYNYHRDGVDTSGWNKWKDLGGGFSAFSAPALIHRGGFLEMAAVGEDGHLWYNYHRDGADRDGWNVWKDLGSEFKITLSPALIHREGFLEVIAFGEDGHAWYTYHRDGEGRDAWPSWKDMGGGFGTPSVSMRMVPLPSQASLANGDDQWSCGVHCATRLLASYGFDVSLSQMLEEIGPLKILGNKVPVGQSPAHIVAKLQKYDTQAKYKQFVSFDYLKRLVAAGKPVASLLFLGSLDEKIPLLHWIVVAGFDDTSQSVLYYDTYTNALLSEEYSVFLAKWAWQGWKSVDTLSESLYSALATNIYGALNHQLGRNTIFWIDRTSLRLKNMEGRSKAGPAMHDVANVLPDYRFEVEGRGVSDCHIYRAYDKAVSECARNFGTDSSHVYVDFATLQSSYRDVFAKRGAWDPWGRTGARKCRYWANVLCYSLAVGR